MWSHQLLLAFRHLIKQRMYAVINIGGLAVGLATCMLIFLHIQDERSYDQFHEHKDHVYRVDQTDIWSDVDIPFGSTGPAVATAIKAEIPDVEEIVRLHTPGEFLINRVKEDGSRVTSADDRILAADSNFFNVFTFPLVEGNELEALKNPNSIVLTRSAATKYFGESSATGKILNLKQGDRDVRYLVTGVMEDVPNNSHIRFDMLVSMTSFPLIKKRETWSWIWTTFVTYVKVRPDTEVDQLAEKLFVLPRTYTQKTMEWVLGYSSFEDYEAAGKKWELFLMPIEDIRLKSNGSWNRVGGTGDIQTVYILGGVALLILLLSIINFVNLTTARSTQRAKEVGIKKVLGSQRKALIGQFMTESFLYSSIAILIGLGFAYVGLNYFNQITGKELGLLNNPNLWWGLGILWVTTALLAGAYPAFYLSSFQPVSVLKSKLTPGVGTSGIRNAMVTFQFTISVSLIIATLLISDQLTYLTKLKLGIDKEQVVVVRHGEFLENQLEVFKDQISTQASIEEVSVAGGVPPRVFMDDYFEPASSEVVEVALTYAMADENYLKCLGIQLREGRDFDRGRVADNQSVILNERAVRELGWGDYRQDSTLSVLGKQLFYKGREEPYTVIGVVKDFHYQYLGDNIGPFALFNLESQLYAFDERMVAVRLSESLTSEQVRATLEEVESSWQALVGGTGFDYFFVDEAYASSFMAEAQLSKIMNVFSFLAILIACLGLLGLTAFTTEQRTKEVGIRKILGANLNNLLLLLSRDLLKWVVFSLIFAVPIAYISIRLWLDDFTYKMDISWLTFVFSIMICMGVAWLTMMYHTLKVANQNPVKSLRYE